VCENPKPCVFVFARSCLCVCVFVCGHVYLYSRILKGGGMGGEEKEVEVEKGEGVKYA
jgi:hypothetical protein